MATTIPVNIELRGIDRLSGSLKKSSRSFDRFSRSAGRAERRTKTFGRTMTGTMGRLRMGSVALGTAVGGLAGNLGLGAGLGVGAAAAFTVKKFLELEDAQIGVQKTTDLTDAQIGALTDRFTKLSTQIPKGRAEMLGIAEVAGQLGVKGVDDLTKFSTVIAKFTEATNLKDIETASLTLARLLNQTNEGVGVVDRLGSTIVKLGNEFAAQESEIVHFAENLGGIIQFGAKSKDVVAIATAFKAVGGQAEAGGSAIQKTFFTIQKALRKGGKELNDLTKITGLSAAALKKGFEEDSVGVFEKFVTGLGRIKEEGGDVTRVMERLGLTDIRVNREFGKLVGNTKLLSQALRTANGEWEDNNALNKEAANRFKSTSSQLRISMNRIENAATRIGKALAPVVAQAASGLATIVEKSVEWGKVFDRIAFSPAIKALARFFDGGQGERNQAAIIDLAEGRRKVERAKAVKSGDFEKVRELDAREARRKERKEAGLFSIKSFANKIFTPSAEREARIQAIKAEVAAKKRKRISGSNLAAERNITKTNSSTTTKETKVTVELKNVPEGTKVKTTGDNSGKNFNLMMSRGVQGVTK